MTEPAGGDDDLGSHRRRSITCAVQHPATLPLEDSRLAAKSNDSPLKDVAFFAGLPDTLLWHLGKIAEKREYAKGDVLFMAVGITYLFVFHLLQGRTLGMRLMKMRVIDVYGDRPSPARCGTGPPSSVGCSRLPSRRASDRS